MLQRLLRRIITLSFKSTRTAHTKSPASFGLESQDVTIPTIDGGQLFGWWIPADVDGHIQPSPTVIALHGWGANASDMLDIAPWINKAGFNALFFDARCHGKSSQTSFTSLLKFTDDLESARTWVMAHNHVEYDQIISMGHSVGAASVLFSASRSQWGGVVSLSAFAHPADMMQRYLEGHGIKNRLMSQWLLSEVQTIIGSSFDAIAPEYTIGKALSPVLLVHGSDDKVVPLEDAHRISRNASMDTIFLPVPGAGHDLRPALEYIAPHVINFIESATFRKT